MILQAILVVLAIVGAFIAVGLTVAGLSYMVFTARPAVAAWVGGAIVAVTIGSAVLALTRGGRPDPGFSHVQLETDRAMTQQMAVVAGPGMDAQMVGYGMLGRTQDPAYTAALEAHTDQFQRMLGQG